MVLPLGDLDAGAPRDVVGGLDVEASFAALGEIESVDVDAGLGTRAAETVNLRGARGGFTFEEFDQRPTFTTAPDVGVSEVSPTRPVPPVT
ncbi:hypothetical protein ACISU4_03230 [Streptomyces wuyuanensis]|uniref:hypothetical protein n=1 Tax=Streptomyces wuyuanensis TaxID=1196353 RepID=UPI0037FC3A09